MLLRLQKPTPLGFVVGCYTIDLSLEAFAVRVFCLMFDFSSGSIADLRRNWSGERLFLEFDEDYFMKRFDCCGVLILSRNWTDFLLALSSSNVILATSKVEEIG